MIDNEKYEQSHICILFDVQTSVQNDNDTTHSGTAIIKMISRPVSLIHINENDEAVSNDSFLMQVTVLK